MKTKWSEITMRMAADYGFTTRKGSMLHTISLLCKKAEYQAARLSLGYEDDLENINIRYDDYEGKIGILGYIPSCVEEAGTDFSEEDMQCRLRGISYLFNDLCYTQTTHDLNSFNIPRLGELLAEIRLS